MPIPKVPKALRSTLKADIKRALHIGTPKNTVLIRQVLYNRYGWDRTVRVSLTDIREILETL